MICNTKVKVILLLLFILELCVESQSKVQCGVPKIRETKLIVNGHGVVNGAWPWHTAVYQWKGLSDTYTCGGTLVSEHFVLTAAHCVTSSGNGYQLLEKSIFIRLGVYNLHELFASTLQQHSIQKIYRHANYTYKSVQNDIAILQLATGAEFNDYVQPACLGLEKDLTGDFGTVVGWGWTENEELSPILKCARMPVIDPVTCLESDRGLFGETLSKGIFCAGYTNGTTVCNGDSGSGLFFSHNDAFYLGGIVSYTGARGSETNLCNLEGYGAFTNVQTYLPWITSIVGQQLNGDEKICAAIDVQTKGNNSLLPEKCGVIKILQGSGVTNHADLHEFPWMTILRYTNRSQRCEGSLISSRYVLTAAQCVEQNNLPNKVILGEYYIGKHRDCIQMDSVTKCAPPVQEHEIECISRHPNYSKHLQMNNIALIRLTQNVTFDDHIRPVCLPVTQPSWQLNLHRYTVSSWGKVTNEALGKIEVVPVAIKECHGSSKDVQHPESHHCARKILPNTPCYWNTGAPLGKTLTYNGKRFIQFGITISSATNRCQRKEASLLYTKISDNINWIMANLNP